MKCILYLLGLATLSPEIREARFGDALGIARVLIDTRRVTNQGLVPDSYLRNMSYAQAELEFRESLREPAGTQIVLVAENWKKQLVGFVNGKPTVEAPGDDSIEMKELYLLPTFQRNGIGQGLVSSFMKKALERQIRRVYVWVLAGNPSRNFYEKLGATFDREAERTIGGETCKLAVYYWDEKAMNRIAARALSPQGTPTGAAQ